MQSLEGRFESISIKALVIAILTVLMLWPLFRVESLVTERQALQHQAYDVIAAGFGGPQIVGAPIISIETQERSIVVDPATKISTEVWSAGPSLHLLPDDVRVANDVAVEVRSKGIYSIPVYVSKVVITGEFRPDAIARLLASNVDTRVLSTHAVFQLPLSGVKYLRTLTRFEVGGQSLRGASGEAAGFAALSAPIDLQSMDGKNPVGFRLELDVAGSDSLHFLPLGSNTVVMARIAWPHPDFDGAFFPVGVRLRNERLAQMSNPDALSLEGVDGLFCALIASPDMVAPSEYLPVILGGDQGASGAFADLADANATMSLLMRYWNSIIADFERESIHLPYLVDVEPAEIPGREWARGR